ncbi:unnamed protein product, partial [Ectocarpus sp. 8 AP-2014]
MCQGKGPSAVDPMSGNTLQHSVSVSSTAPRRVELEIKQYLARAQCLGMKHRHFESPCHMSASPTKVDDKSTRNDRLTQLGRKMCPPARRGYVDDINSSLVVTQHAQHRVETRFLTTKGR